jgi:hypothetical protein
MMNDESGMLNSETGAVMAIREDEGIRDRDG